MILIVDDDRVFSDLVSGYLCEQGYRTVVAASRGQALTAVDQSVPAVALVDLGLPDGDGLALASDLSALPDVGVIIVSGRDDPIDRVAGIESGADDYVSKPPNLRELLARVRAVDRRVRGARDRAAPAGETTLTFGDFILDTTLRQVRDEEGQIIRLTTAEYDLLDALTRNLNQAISRDQLTEHVFGRRWNPEDRGVDRLVASLRHKLNDNVDEPHILITVRGKGYQLAG